MANEQRAQKRAYAQEYRKRNADKLKEYYARPDVAERRKAAARKRNGLRTTEQVERDNNYLKEYRKSHPDMRKGRGSPYTREKAKRRKDWSQKPENKPTIAKWNRGFRERVPETTLLCNARQRARKDGVPFTITKADIFVPTHCPVLGIPLKIGRGKPEPNSPSLDKIRPELGYVYGNVIVVSHLANSIKTNATVEQIAATAKYYGLLLKNLKYVGRKKGVLTWHEYLESSTHSRT